MDEVEAGQPRSPASPVRAGEMLSTARAAQGLTLAEIASRTRIPQRHLEALESGAYSSLPSPTYAVGFAKAYARAVGADEIAVAQSVRGDLDQLGPRAPEYVPYETADPARVPSRGVAIVALGLALAVLILVGLWYGTNVFRSGNGETVATQEIAAAPAMPAPAAAMPTPVPAAGGQVSFVARNDVWLRVYDADNKTLYLGTLKPGEHYDVPRDAKEPMINVGRPDQLDVTLDGKAVPPLGTGEHAIKDVRVSGAALAARIAGSPAPLPSATPGAASSPSSGQSPRRSGATRSAARPEPRPTPQLSETQRANLDSARQADNATQ